METAENIEDSLQQGEWVISLDLTDAYFHIPIHPRFQKYLHFNVGNRSYQFTALPFGHLDTSLTQDRSLCPVRALKYYLDRTKDLRKNKNLLFVAIKEGFTRDISRATISSWLKQTILLAYEKSDSECQQLCQVKAHDVHSMAASLVFKGEVSLSEILEACFWKSHNTFTNFYLKDLCWLNGQILKLGPIVYAQHVINL